MDEPSTSQGISHFLRVPHIEVPMGHRIRSEPFIDYSQSQILTSADHVEKLEQIAEKKACIEQERAAKLKERELTKARRAEERVIAAAAKERRAVEKEARKISKQNWTTTAVRAAGESIQQLVKNTSSQEDRRPRLGVEARSIAKHNKVIAKARLEAKKHKVKHGIWLPNQPLPSLIEHPSFYGCFGVFANELGLLQQLP